MSYNVQPLRTQQEINDFLFCLRRNKNADRDVFLFLIGINSGLRMSDIVKLKKQDLISSRNPRIVEKKTGKNNKQRQSTKSRKRRRKGKEKKKI